MKPAIRPRATEIARRLETSPAVVDHYLERYFELVASEKLEAHMYQRFGRQEIDRVIEIQGLEHLRTALAHGNGAILYSGHVAGHFTLFAALSIHGFPLTMLGFPQDLEQWVASRRNAFFERRLGAEFLRMQDDDFGIAMRAVNVLRRNRVLTIEIDQTTTASRVATDFLGSPGWFPRGPALIAKAGGAPLLQFWIHRTEGWIPQVAAIGEPLYVHDVDDAVRACAAELERSIRNDPPSWLPWLFSRRLVWDE
jgi:KDO2-lipid IV(A) lauroyltransferase